mmetsp:Transcript_19250/g.16485  ORF Transcript_19250/g.16485 Transcript_19250/m.16485 type:complete len:200 (+) Transcript_19250:562-1161(+)
MSSELLLLPTGRGSSSLRTRKKVDVILLILNVCDFARFIAESLSRRRISSSLIGGGTVSSSRNSLLPAGNSLGCDSFISGNAARTQSRQTKSSKWLISSGGTRLSLPQSWHDARTPRERNGEVLLRCHRRTPAMPSNNTIITITKTHHPPDTAGLDCWRNRVPWALAKVSCGMKKTDVNKLEPDGYGTLRTTYAQSKLI